MKTVACAIYQHTVSQEDLIGRCSVLSGLSSDSLPDLFILALRIVVSVLRVSLKACTALCCCSDVSFFPMSVSCSDHGTLCSHQTGWRFSTGAEQSGIPGPFPLTTVTQALGSKLS